MPYRKVKPMPNEKVERNSQMYDYWLKSNATYAEMASLFGISAARVFQIIRRIDDRERLGKQG